MPSFKSYGFWCAECAHETIELVDRTDDPPATFPCERCDAAATPKVSAAVMVAAHPDGTKRWAGIKARRVLEKEGRKALRRGKHDDAKRIDRELTKLKRGS